MKNVGYIIYMHNSATKPIMILCLPVATFSSAIIVNVSHRKNMYFQVLRINTEAKVCSSFHNKDQ